MLPSPHSPVHVSDIVLVGGVRMPLAIKENLRKVLGHIDTV